MKSSLRSKIFAPLVGVLKRIQFSLESDAPPKVMLAAQKMEEFKSQELPDHCKVTQRKLRGPRVPVRRPDNPLVIARWPRDRLVEGTMPSLVFVLNGQADIQIADYLVHCHANDILFLPARIPKMDGSRPHYETVTDESHCDLLFLSLLPVGLHSLSVHICHSQKEHHEMSAPGESCWLPSRIICLLFDALAEISQGGRNTKSTFHLVSAIVSLLKEDIEDGKCFTQEDFPSRSLSLDNLSPISKALEYIQNHLDRSLSIDLVARWVGLSRTVFVKQFREETNESFKAYLTRMRLNKAKVLLCQTRLSIEQISKRVGLSSGQLRNLFSEEYQCSPREFRSSQRKAEIDGL